MELSILAELSLATGILSLVCLAALHFVSPEFKPSWRMVSEYALGRHKWLLTSFFVFWAVSILGVTILLWNLVTSGWALAGIVLLAISCVGTLMGGLFDVKHKLHGLAALLGIPTLCIAALLISYNLIGNGNLSNYTTEILFSAHSTWISLVLMAISMGILMSGFKKAGIETGQVMEVSAVLPDGVVAVNGYANRILIVSYISWVLLVAVAYLSV